ncbi:MAG: alpha/beta hydrolase [Acidimicrobiales bacterium]|nr:alpha/beta hydrolase [Acidimicrobiales bacterium]
MLKSFAGGRLFGATWGPNPARVLVLHGWRRTHADFDPVFDQAPATAGAVGLDLFGFGATPSPPAAWGSRDYARAVADVFADPGVLGDRVVVVGHSFGGRIALLLWEFVPDRIERMVLTGVPLLDRSDRRMQPAFGFRMVRRLHAWGLVGDARMESLRQRHGSADYRAATGVMRDVFVRVLHEDYRQAIAAIQCPVDLVWGADDTETPLEVAERALPLFSSASLTVLPGVGHLVPTEDPRDLAAAVLGPGDQPVAPGRVDRSSDRTAFPRPGGRPSPRSR